MRDQLVTDLAAKVGRKPSKAGQVRRSTATLVAWDAATLRGSVSWNGTIIRDIPLLGAIDAFGWQAGDEVVVDTIPGSVGGFSSPMILGRVFRPGAANAAKVLQALQSEVARQIIDEVVQELLVSPAGQDLAAFVVGQRVHTNQVFGIGTRNSTSYGALSGLGSLSIADVPISSSGKALVGVGCDVNCTLTSGREGFMSAAISGATTRAANDAWAFALGTGGAGGDKAVGASMMMSVQAGLNEGNHTFTARYRTITTAGNVSFANPLMVVIAF